MSSDILNFKSKYLYTHLSIEPSYDAVYVGTPTTLVSGRVDGGDFEEDYYGYDYYYDNSDGRVQKFLCLTMVRGTSNFTKPNIT